MEVSFFVARRFLRSRRNSGFISFITFFAVVGVALGVAALIITLSILQGFERTIKENVVSFTAHMQIYGFQSQALHDPASAIRKVQERFPQVDVMAPYVSREAMIRSQDAIDGVLIKGIDPTNDISAARQRLVDGSYDLEVREDGVQTVLLGKRLAERLNVKIGDRVLVFALGGYSLTLSQARVMQFVVTGFYETGMEEYDASYVYVHIGNAQKLFQFGKSISGFDVLVKDLSSLGTLVQEIPADLGYPYYARTMFQMYRNLFSWIELQKSQIPIILGLIIIVATVNVIGTLLMMVMEKIKDIGVLQTLGASRSTVSRIFLIQGMFIGVVGTMAGNVLAFVLCWIEMEYRVISLPSGIYYMTHVPIVLSWFNFALVSASALVLCYFCSFLPSRLAGHQDPVALLRFAQ
ncbi:MAG: ABC transporter permease [Ignavibacteriales bacterium]|nr:ABC transporter permease [Ignavibacteriales bacterium]